MKQFRSLCILFCFFTCLFLHAQEPISRNPLSTTVEERVKVLLDSLTHAKLLHTEEDWVQCVTSQNTCSGEHVAKLLIQLSRSFRPTNTLEGAVGILSLRKIIKDPTYWLTHAVNTNSCTLNRVEEILISMLAYLPNTLPRPASADGPPIQAITPSQVKPQYDLVIAGAGTGGCGVAIQAARMGCSVLLLEETDWIGGQLTAAGVSTMDEGSPLVRQRGLYQELCGNIDAYYQALGINPVHPYGRYCVEPCVARDLLHRMLGHAKGAGTLDLLLYTQVTQVMKEGDQVIGVELTSTHQDSEETQDVFSRILVDATEWGDVIPLTGAAYRTGNCTNDAINTNQHTQSLTWTATLKQYPEGIPSELLFSKPPPRYKEALKRLRKTLCLGKEEALCKTAPWSWQRFIGYRALPNSRSTSDYRIITRTQLNFNNDFHTKVADLEDKTQRLTTSIKALKKTLNLLYYIQSELEKTDWTVANDEGYDTPYQRRQIDSMLIKHPELTPFRNILYHFSIIPYARESRRIVGLHTLKASEIQRKPHRPVQFPHTVALGDYAIDLHGSKLPCYLELTLDRVEDIPHRFGQRGIGPFAIPFECFIPEKIDGFLPAEKNISQSRMVNGATRLQPHTLLMGQAVGVIAALSIQQGVQPRNVDPLSVQKVLLNSGCPLSIDPVSSQWKSEEWQLEQLQALYGPF